ncbi:tetratricopeptide repeat protein [Marinilabilia rubra]|uniref:Uncharacterized protein n=1 Tax=Marinilabilia rubra TaxID=2162893 RepID=A0A2U2B6A2_9BACT|nr:PD40 domain-containing protein [Marinilabilia rubra]PWD98598.1 hypothetical protein DDZ16_14125 [Marinilabilia rubra]
MRLVFTTLFIIISSLISANAQENTVSPDQALELFRNGKYGEALPMYKQLIERYDREAKYNYYLGVCLIEQRQDNSQAIKRLKYALSRRINRDVHYYLGRAYQNAYQFELATKEFEAFLKYATNTDPRRTKAKRAIEDCVSGEQLINKHFSIKVVKKDTVNEHNFIDAYELPEDAGTLARNKSFFKTGVPPENIMYRTEKGDDVYFVLNETDTTTHDIYMMEQLLDRWSGSKNLREPVNSDYDDRNPFLMVDGTTFFFASDRPGGMGGLDIYRSIYDPESNTYSEPENLGSPFNSPADDYLFAADIFDERAWFTTNRGVEPGKAVVVKLVWDNKVFKNLTEDIEQIKTIASLPLADGNFWDERASEQENGQGRKNKTDQEEFRFYINDTIVYTRYEHFLSDAARSEFKRGRSIDMKKDSLEQMMRNKRQRYAQSYNQEELNQLMDEILQLEKKVYGHGDQIKRHYIRARQMETEKISQLKNSGNYNNSHLTKPGSFNNEGNKPSFKPASYSFYSDEEFLSRKERLNPMYEKYFNPAQIKTLQRTDSMYTWANILKLEGSKMLAESMKSNEQEDELSLLDKMRNLDSLKGKKDVEPTNPLPRKARELQKQALDLYHQALDKKFNIYKPTIEQMAGPQKEGHLSQLLRKAQSYFEKANNGLEKMNTWNPERYEQLGGLKRQGIEILEDGLISYSPDKTIFNASNKVKTKGERQIQDNYQEIQNNREAQAKQEKPAITKPKSPTNVVESAFGNNSATEKSALPVFKIQIGVFRNTPDANALSKIPEISSEAIQGKEITKYYSGNWSNYEEANSHVNQVRNNGFPGAFVVAFFNGKQIPVNKAKELAN